MNGALRAAVWVALAVVAAGFMQPHIPLAPSTLHTGLTFRARHNAICQRERTFSLRPQCVTGDKPAASERPASPPLPALPGLPTVEIEYCTGCRWLLRAAWLAQVCDEHRPRASSRSACCHSQDAQAYRTQMVCTHTTRHSGTGASDDI